MILGGTKIMQEPNAKYQYLTALVVNLLTIAFGISEGWTSPVVLLLTSNQTPLASGVISMEQASWLASLMCVGNLFGSIFFAYFTSKFGRKLPLLIISAPIIISWIIVIYAPNVQYLYAARILGGFFGGGSYSIAPLFLAEIANDRVRGLLVSTMNLTENFGIFLAFAFGAFFDFHMTPKFVIALTILFGISFSFFPESPAFLLKQNRISEAQKSIRFYQNLRDGSRDDKLVEYEIDKLKNNINIEEKIARGKSHLEIFTNIRKKSSTFRNNRSHLEHSSTLIALHIYFFAFKSDGAVYTIVLTCSEKQHKFYIKFVFMIALWIIY